MLPLPNLDDRTFEQMVMDSRKMIPKLSPEWTDENAHDPGITFMELFAWLAEMQQYYLDRISLRNERKFLKMLGVTPLPARSSKAILTLDNIESPCVVAAGTRVTALDQVFETEHALSLCAARLEKVLVRTESNTADYTASNQHGGVTYYAFGREAVAESRLFLAFNQPLPVNENYTLHIRLYHHDREEHVQSSVRAVWQYYGGDSVGWHDLTPSGDETQSFSRSGCIHFRIPKEMKPLLIHPANDIGRYWISCTLEESGFELPPKLERISLHAVQARQQDTWCECLEFDATGEPDQNITVTRYLPYYGKLRIQVKDKQGGWRYWESISDWQAATEHDQVYLSQRDEERQTVTIHFGNGRHGQIPAKGERMIRLIAFRDEFESMQRIGRINGLPHQKLMVYESAILPQFFRLQIGNRVDEQWVWHDWEQVEDFDNSRSSDKHYCFNPETGELQFGNNEQGWIPPVEEDDHVWIIAMKTGGGSRGNVKSGMINQLQTAHPRLQGLRVTNDFPASGGRESETVRDAKLRFQQELRLPSRAVTETDAEVIVRNTPGLHVERVKALPLYRPGMKDYPTRKMAGQLTVVVVPYGEGANPLPGHGFLKTVKDHLDQHRLLTTETHVIAPEYIQITVHAVIIVEPYFKEEREQITAMLYKLLRPLGDKDGERHGWEFGRPVYKGDVYEAIHQIKGVAYVQDLWLDAAGRNIRKDDNGDIFIPPNGLVYSGVHEAELISRTDVV